MVVKQSVFFSYIYYQTIMVGVYFKRNFVLNFSDNNQPVKLLWQWRWQWRWQDHDETEKHHHYFDPILSGYHRCHYVVCGLNGC